MRAIESYKRSGWPPRATHRAGGRLVQTIAQSTAPALAMRCRNFPDNPSMPSVVRLARSLPHEVVGTPMNRASVRRSCYGLEQEWMELSRCSAVGWGAPVDVQYLGVTDGRI